MFYFYAHMIPPLTFTHFIIVHKVIASYFFPSLIYQFLYWLQASTDSTPLIFLPFDTAYNLLEYIHSVSLLNNLHINVVCEKYLGIGFSLFSPNLPTEFWLYWSQMICPGQMLKFALVLQRSRFYWSWLNIFHVLSFVSVIAVVRFCGNSLQG